MRGFTFRSAPSRPGVVSRSSRRNGASDDRLGCLEISRRLYFWRAVGHRGRQGDRLLARATLGSDRGAPSVSPPIRTRICERPGEAVIEREYQVRLWRFLQFAKGHDRQEKGACLDRATFRVDPGRARGRQKVAGRPLGPFSVLFWPLCKPQNSTKGEAWTSVRR